MPHPALKVRNSEGPRTRGADGACVRTMLVDDSLVVRSILERILGDEAGIDIVASVSGATDALAYLSPNSVDVIVLDIEMPGMNGIAALPELLRQSRGARVLILSSNCEDGGPAAIEALALGAADTLAKPGRGSFAGQFGTVLTQRIVALGGGGGGARALPVSPIAPATKARVFSPRDHAHFPRRAPSCILVASSTGGIRALNVFLAELSETVTAPILLAQHLPEAFVPFFARQLADGTERSVHVAEDGMALRERHLYVAPGHAHLTVVPWHGGTGRVILSSAPASSGCRPSADPMFASAAKVYGDGCLAIVLSGMGRDGTDGAADIRSRGGAVIAQSHDSSVVWGMPGAIVAAHLASAVLDPAAAAAYVNAAAGLVRR